ncbi:MAG: L-2-hydroxyglutarate oxidase [Bacteroidetes bacterium]|nr:L-2-hydroxyglutarate oxidase [Bacteroidota bacterium]
MGHFDIIIIGAGIVGTATAMSILNKKSLSIAIIETEKDPALHQTGNNSGVIHSGLYYKPDSLKAKYCIDGRNRLYQFCKEYNLNYEQCGKIVVATNDKEIEALNKLERRGKANGLKGLKRINKNEIKEYEPNVNAIEGLYVPETGIVDYKQVTNQYVKNIISKGGILFTDNKFQSLVRKNDELIVRTNHNEFSTKFLINCAGLYSDRVASLCGVDPEIQIIPFRGEYYELKKDKQSLVKNLIYPVPNPKFPFLGVHFTRMINGGIEAGPNAVLALKREGYSLKDISIKDISEMFTYPGFWKMTAKHYKMELYELYRSFSKKAFVKALNKLIPSITEDDVFRSGAGVRAQALDRNGNLIDDFFIKETKRMIHVLNAPSPAATASLSIGNYISEKVISKYEELNYK